MSRQNRPTSAPAFWLAIGVTIGVLVAVLALPERTRVEDSLTAAGGPDSVGGQAGTGDDLAPVSGSPETPEAGQGAEGAAAAGSEEGTTGAPGSSAAAPGTGASDSQAQRGTTNSGGATARGVTADSIKIGIACVDLALFRQLGQGYNEGDCRAQFEAALDRARREGRLPVHGRDVSFVYRRHGLLSADENRASCEGFMRDDKVFAVLANQYYFLGGMECVAREFKTPVLTTEGIQEATIEGGAPYAFVMTPTLDRVLRNYAHWIHARGLAKGKRIGLYTSTSTGTDRLVQRNFETEMKKLGYTFAEKFVTTQQVAGPDDQLAVQRFRAAKVELAVLLVNGVAQSSFMQTADSQGYKPAYVESDYHSSSQDTAASTFPESQFDGSYAFTTATLGETGTAETAPEKACLDNYRRYTGSEGPKRGVAEWHYIEFACDLTDLLLVALEGAGSNLTPEGLVRGFETIRDRPTSFVPRITFGPGKHAGGDLHRTIQWRRSCRCYMAVSPFEPLFVP